MSNWLRKLRDVIGISLLWGALWAASGAVLTLVVGAIDPKQIDPGEGPVDVAAILGRVGFISGVIFGILLSTIERRKTISELPLVRVVMWGILASAAFPLLTMVDRAMLTCSLGAVSALVSVAIARTAALWRQQSI